MVVKFHKPCNRKFSIICAIFALFSVYGVGDFSIRASGTVDTLPGTFERDALACGPNSLFMFLILSRRSDVPLAELEALPRASNGVSLLTLRDTARQFQVDAEIRRYRPEEIDLMPLPAIAQFKLSTASIGPYHFNVIYKIGAQSVDMLDGTTGFKHSIRRSRLDVFWTGYAMTEKRSARAAVMEGWSPTLMVSSALILDFIILSSFIGWLRGAVFRERSKVIKGVGVEA